MRLMPWFAATLLLAAVPAFAFTPADFVGTWSIRRIVGASDVVGSADPRKLLGTRLEWTPTAVTSAEGTCTFTSAAVQTISNDMLEHFLWGGQRISGLNLPRQEIKSAFGSKQTEVYYDGGKGCVEAVMLNRNHVVFLFQNGYLYLLERVTH